MSEIDERVWQLRNGIIQRLNNPEGLQEEEVDALICAALAEGAEQERERIRQASSCAALPSEYSKNSEAIYWFPASILAPTKETGK